MQRVTSWLRLLGREDLKFDSVEGCCFRLHANREGRKSLNEHWQSDQCRALTGSLTVERWKEVLLVGERVHEVQCISGIRNGSAGRRVPFIS